MGGFGSGRYPRAHTKLTTDDYPRLDVRRLARNGALTPAYSRAQFWTRNGETVASIELHGGRDRVFLSYHYRSGAEEWKNEGYPVRIVRTLCAFGGSRPWFACPVTSCGRRVAILYGGEIFACRHCHQLAYASSRECPGDRAIRRADRIRACLGWEPGILNYWGDKPKWMRWGTFRRLAARHDALVRQAIAPWGHRA
jgi:hypothetical protein